MVTEHSQSTLSSSVDVGLENLGASSAPSHDGEDLADEVVRLRAENRVLLETLSQQDNRIICIQEIGVALGSAMSLDELLNVIMEKITVLMLADRSTLFLIDNASSTLWSKIVQGDRVNEIRLAVGEGIAGWVAQTGQSINIRNAYQDSRFNSEVDLRTGYQTRSILCQPIRNNKGEFIGVIQVLNSKNEFFSDADENLLSAIASQTAVSIENSMMYLSMVNQNLELSETQLKLEKKIREVDFLYGLQQQIAQAVDLPELFRSVALRALEVAQAEVCSVALRDNEHLRIFTLRRNADDDVEFLTHHAALDEGVCGLTIRKGASQRINLGSDAELVSAALKGWGIVPRFAISVPLFETERCIGAVELINKRSDPRGDFDHNDMNLLALLADQISGAIAVTLSREHQEKATRLETIGQMLSGVIHDFKTPVTIISGYVQLMARQNDTAVRKEYAASVIKQFDHLNKMTKEILAFARGDSTLLLRKVFLHNFAEELEELLGREFSDRNINMRIDTLFRGAVKMDDVKLKRAVFNLARNAIEAMPQGGGFHIIIERSGDDAVFTFSDTGGGIPVEIRASLFESFVTQGKQGGTGLGLAIVKRIVEEHNGHISFTSEVGHGTSFVVRIPIGLPGD